MTARISYQQILRLNKEYIYYYFHTHKNNYNLEIATFGAKTAAQDCKNKTIRIAIYTFVLQPCCLYCCILFIIFWQWSKNMFYLAFNDISRNWWQKNDSWWQNFSRKQILDILSWLPVATISSVSNIYYSLRPDICKYWTFSSLSTITALSSVIYYQQLLNGVFLKVVQPINFSTKINVI